MSAILHECFTCFTMLRFSLYVLFLWCSKSLYTFDHRRQKIETNIPEHWEQNLWLRISYLWVDMLNMIITFLENEIWEFKNSFYRKSEISKSLITLQRESFTKTKLWDYKKSKIRQITILCKNWNFHVNFIIIL